MNPADQHITNHRITVVGLGKSGAAVARFCRQQGARVTVTEMAARERFADEARALEDLGVTLEFGGHRPATFEKADLVVLSPGVPHTMAPLTAARDRGTPVIGEIELAARYIDAPILAVTGTNGKTTTTELIGSMLAASGVSVFVGGNIGTPLIDYVAGGLIRDWLVIEVSSFQLDTIDGFRPRIGVLLNVSADHLDRYPDFAAYAESKMQLFANQHADDTAVLNAADPSCRTAAQHIRGQVLMFGAAADRTRPGALIAADHIVFELPEGRPHRIDLDRWSPAGHHNRENAAAAGLAALSAGATPQGVQTTIDTFEGLAHRLSHVRTLRGVRYFDDSKATNVDAVCRALEGFDDPVVLIMGGRDKGGGYQSLEAPVAARVRTLVVLGEAADDIAAALGHLVPTHRAGDMADAVRLAADQARANDVVLLSPACASFDMYASYHQRGEDFCRHVQQLT
ncbi:MAG: UDP-N-acetylmuramoyl-L-alanine--D-glutamate ligase [Desulfobacterales bacterium]|nr:UDP-N-acetylmuramoyl-L-alanine--D-glutamate ligase [Desulfobacterales bacterium]